MQFHPAPINGVYSIDLFHKADDRGVFVKTFHKDSFAALDLETQFDESFYSSSLKGVVRGMHFQLPPHDHAKIIYCTSGRLLDVVVDLRKDSPTFGHHFSLELSGTNFKAIYIPKGLAHGFAVLEDQTTMVYLTSTMHQPSADTGIRWDSFGFEWPVKSPIISERDESFESLANFKSPF